MVYIDFFTRERATVLENGRTEDCIVLTRTNELVELRVDEEVRQYKPIRMRNPASMMASKISVKKG